ncbi:HGL123Wp [Eremothecium sinecaudum]|uniref:HGL123Wp n=1 Tax=Eremothecium sinecaudum TaxID=45286 RepID=A0A120K2Q0_9SACH|nr:HGL123Wp [Eremothecium sinecaudum]AMD22217.1 HGL123Wp [Eremothecium sinecaudum]
MTADNDSGSVGGGEPLPPKRSRRIINCVAQLPFMIQTHQTENKESDWTIEALTGNSALYSSVEYLSNSSDWEQHVVGWTGEITMEGDADDPMYLTQEDKKYVAEQLQQREDSTHDLTVHPVWLLRKDQNRWRGYAEKVLWPAFHYILNPPSDCQQESTWWYDYVKFNEAYAMKVAQIYQPGDIIWVHDYYLMLLPQLLRMRFNDAVIGYFHHAPWPSNEYFRCLSKRKELLDGLLGADRVCFQNEGFCRHFVSGCKRLLDAVSKKLDIKTAGGGDVYEVCAYGGDVIVDSLPIGVDTHKILKDAFTEDVDEKVKQIRSAYQGKKIIIGRDRLDGNRGVVQKLQAFAAFLSMFPEWRGKVVLIQVSGPTSAEKDHRLELQVNELVHSINSEYGDLNYSPVQHYHMRIPKDVYFSLLRAADLCLITSVRDGMNTTALEFVTVKSEKSRGAEASPLVLSEFSGSSHILSEAIMVNPWDSVAVAKAINNALNLDADENRKLEDLLWKNIPTIQHWTDLFLDDMLNLQNKKANSDTSKKVTPALNRPLLLQNYQNSKRRLFLFDYDGTLTPIVQDPNAAIPSGRLLNILNKLSSDPKNQIWIISGRDQKFLSRWLGDQMPQLGLSAEHGCFMKDVNSQEWTNLASKFDMSWQIRAAEIMEEFTNKTPGSFIERKKVALTWHYRRAVPELGEFNASELKKMLDEFAVDNELEVMEGKANIEVRPRFVNKGEIVKRIVWTPHGSNQCLEDDFSIDEDIPKDLLPDFVLCLGDDFTDEDMFRQLIEIESKWAEKFPDDRNGWGHYGVHPVTVGSASKKTVAKTHLTDPHQVLDTLGLLVGDVSLFQSAGTVDLDDRGHVKNSASSMKSEIAGAAYAMRRSGSLKSNNDKK